MRSQPVLDDFVTYCKANPDLRFWQALNAWSRKDVFLVSPAECTEDEWLSFVELPGVKDPFYFEGKDR